VFCYAEEAHQKMPYCPECGGDMQYIAMTKRYACKSCGLSVTNQELIELRDQLRPRAESKSEERKKAHKEYLKWWLGKKK
jgi:tRNA(Ile2) C34 agmatinyltransferase TiaS